MRGGEDRAVPLHLIRAEQFRSEGRLLDAWVAGRAVDAQVRPEPGQMSENRATPRQQLRPVAVFPTIDETLTGVCAFDPVGRRGAFSRSRRILAKVFLRSVLKLGTYRNEGSRIDFMGPCRDVCDSDFEAART